MFDAFPFILATRRDTLGCFGHVSSRVLEAIYVSQAMLWNCRGFHFRCSPDKAGCMLTNLVKLVCRALRATLISDDFSGPACELRLLQALLTSLGCG